MANGLYDKARESILYGATIAWGDLTTTVIKAQLVDIAGGHYVANLATHQYLSSIASGDRIGTAVTLTNRTVTAGVAGADNFSTSAITAGAQQCGLVIYQDTPGTGDADRRLIAYYDAGSGLPVTPNGSTISVTWDGTNMCFKL